MTHTVLPTPVCGAAHMVAGTNQDLEGSVSAGKGAERVLRDLYWEPVATGNAERSLAPVAPLL